MDEIRKVARRTALTNIDKMHFQYGYGKGFCHECNHFRRECWNKKATKKVVGYDDAGKEIVEYESFLACGLIGKPFPDSEIAGQITIEELLKGGNENGEY